MAIAPSKLGRFVLQKGFSYPTSESAFPRDHAASDNILLRRLREAGLARAEVTDAEVSETFEAARREHAAGRYSPFNSPEERVRVFLLPYLTEKGRLWAEPLKSLNLPDEIESPNLPDGVNESRPWWKFWKR